MKCEDYPKYNIGEWVSVAGEPEYRYLIVHRYFFSDGWGYLIKNKWVHESVLRKFNEDI